VTNLVIVSGAPGPGVEDGAPEGGVDDVGRAVQALRGPEDLAAKAVGDHHVLANGHTEHGHSSS